MKFVKGDAIAGLVVIVVNLIGGIAVGMLSRGMSISEALHEYTLLTIGDALIAQIPALLLSITAATVVTRVTGESKLDLGRDIVVQLSADPRALRLAAAVLLAMGLVPGFPAPVFLVLALVFGAASFVVRKRQDEAMADTGTGAAGANRAAVGQAAGTRPAALRGTGAANHVGPGEMAPIVISLSPQLHAAPGIDGLEAKIEQARARASDELGVLVPEVGLAVDPGLTGTRYRIDVEAVPVEDDAAHSGRLLLRDDPANLDLMGIPAQRNDAGNAKGKVWVDGEHGAALAKAGIAVHDCADMLSARISDVLAKHTGRFIGIQETKALLTRLEPRYGDLLKEVLRTTPIQRVADVLRRLIDEGVSVRNARLVLEALAEWGEKEHNVVLLTEYVRAALKRQICHRHANAHKVVAAYMLERAAEDNVRAAVRDTAVGPYLVLDEQHAERLLEKVRRVAANAPSERIRPVILTSMDVRRFVRGFLTRNGLDIPVLSYQELADDFTIQPVGTISLDGQGGSASSPKRRVDAMPPGVMPAAS